MADWSSGSAPPSRSTCLGLLCVDYEDPPHLRAQGGPCTRSRSLRVPSALSMPRARHTGRSCPSTRCALPPCPPQKGTPLLQAPPLGATSSGPRLVSLTRLCPTAHAHWFTARLPLMAGTVAYQPRVPSVLATWALLKKRRLGKGEQKGQSRAS